MVFSSFIFLCFFLPVILLLYYLIPNNNFKNSILIIASLFFYAYGEPVYIILLITSVIMNYVFGILLSKKKSKLILTISVLLNIGLLVVFKYLGLIISTINGILPGDYLPVVSIALPIGISFYTFQALSYVIDVYRGDVKAQTNFFKLLLYISFFPQLIAGPIVKYHDISEQITNRIHSSQKVKEGIYRFTTGLTKKILISNEVAKVTDSLYALSNSQFDVLSAWLAAFTYLMQIYFDFSGYSDMAIGLGKMFGFDFLENFNYPYMAKNIQDFWRRWHISLSTWFKEYLYIPLGGNRKGTLRTYINKYIVFAATGIWHGANWTFLVWGLYHGTLLVLEGLFARFKLKDRFKFLNKISFLSFIPTIIIVMVGFVIFRADTLLQGLSVIKAMIGFGASINIANSIMYLTPYYIFIYVLAAFFATNVSRKLFMKIQGKNEVIKMILSFAGLILCFMSLASDSYNPFIYFRF